MMHGQKSIKSKRIVSLYGHLAPDTMYNQKSSDVVPEYIMSHP